MRWAACGLIAFLWLSLAVPALADPSASASTSASDSAQGEAQLWRLDRTARSLDLDRPFALLRLALCGAGIALAAWRMRASYDEPRGARRTRRVMLAATGVLSFSSYYYFFQYHQRGGFESEDVFHYYVGSKYFRELGYYSIYDASLLSLVESRAQDPHQLTLVRDLRSMRGSPPEAALQRGRQAKARFSPERWSSFSSDVRWFHARLRPDEVAHLFLDHGYHPSPVWTLIGGFFSQRVELGSLGFRLLVRADRVLLAIGFSALVWGYGIEIASLAAIVWGTGFLWRYGWVGDSLLRQIWLSSALVGLALARRSKFASAGAVLALPACLRIFPAVFAGGWLLSDGIRSLRERKLGAPWIRFAAGSTAATLVLVTASLSISDEPASLYPMFVAKLRDFAAVASDNKMGAGTLVNALVERAPREAIAGTDVTLPASWASALGNAARWALLAAGIGLFARGAMRNPAWEAAAAGFALIPLATDPTSYYYSFCAAGILLGERRAGIALGLLVACALWAISGLIFYREPATFELGSAIAVALSLAVLAAWGAPVREPANTASSAQPQASTS